jgi:hypothetical protein
VIIFFSDIRRWHPFKPPEEGIPAKEAIYIQQVTKYAWQGHQFIGNSF